jgi:hypothetical protein
LVYALYANVALLAAILVALLSRGAGFGSAAMAASTPLPIAGNGSLFVIPGQLTPNAWGCYLMDVDSQTLCTYWYNGNQLKLVAARSIRHDHELGNFNTLPDPQEVERLVKIEHGKLRVIGDQPATQPDTEK